MPRGTRNYVRNQETLSGVNAGSPTTINCPVNPGIVHNHEFRGLVAGVAATRAQIEAGWDRLEILLNNGSWSEFFITDILKMNDFYGHTFVPGFLSQFFSQDFRENAFDAERNAYVPGAVRNPKFRLYTNGASLIDEIEHYLEVEGVGEGGRNVIAANPSVAARPLIRHEVETITLTDTGNVATEYLYDANTDFIRSMNFEGDNITGIVIEINGVEKYVYRDLARLNERLQQSRAVAVPQANTWHINFELLGGSVDAVYQPEFKVVNNKNQVVQQFNRDRILVKIFASNTNNVRMLAEHYDFPPARSA